MNNGPVVYRQDSSATRFLPWPQGERNFTGSPIPNAQATSVIKTLENQGVVPERAFDVTEEMIDAYVETYHQMFSKTSGPGKKGNLRFAKKMAAVNLMKWSRLHQDIIVKTASKYTTTSGFVYIISNPAFPGCYKIGRTTDLDRRLLTYQTYDPYRQFKIEHSLFFSNVKEVESLILTNYSIDIVGGEWIKQDTALDVFRYLEDIHSRLDSRCASRGTSVHHTDTVQANGLAS